jgi:hypothetical protein
MGEKNFSLYRFRPKTKLVFFLFIVLSTTTFFAANSPPPTPSPLPKQQLLIQHFRWQDYEFDGAPAASGFTESGTGTD